MAVVSVEDVSVRYECDGNDVVALRDVSVGVERGEVLAVLGPSGSGKTSLLNVIAGLEELSSGRVVFDGRLDLAAATESARQMYRRCHVGYVFQHFNLLPMLNAVQNVAVPLLMDHVPVAEADRRARLMLEDLGLGDRLDHRPHQLSGGQQQRVALARAIVHEPDIVVADEPTGNLDSAAGEKVLMLLRSIADQGKAVVVVSHDVEGVRPIADRQALLRDGMLMAGAR